MFCRFLQSFKDNCFILYTYLLTYLLIPRNRVLLEKLTGFQLVKKFHAFYGTRRLITVLTSVRHLSLSYCLFFGATAPPPPRSRASSFTRFLDYTRRATFGRTPLVEWSARRRDLYQTTHNTHSRQTSMPPVGFEPIISEPTPQTARPLGPAFLSYYILYYLP